ncbi:MAG TPA: isoprenylcysteine carboxylmethyltransferase family protein [Allosphingosinicella sp.]|nr:isoprenylcysteine carboxylmethyltransferase family protein [Allosphingosinicella sp.]
MHLFQPQPVGLPGLAAMTAGGILFFAGIARMRAGGAGAAGRVSNLSRVGVLIQMLAFFAVGLGRIVPTLPPESPRALAEAAAIAALMLGSVLLFVSATRAMGANWSVVARLREGHELVTNGIFARLRHPIYVGMAAFLLALALAFGHLAHLLVAAPLFAIGTGVRVREEEKLLRAEFGAAYDDYAAKVKRFLPGII